MLSYIISSFDFIRFVPLSLLAIPLGLVTYLLVSYLNDPLRRIPAAHPLAPFTPLWIAYARLRSVENATIKSAHDLLGPVVRLGPKEISVNSVKGGIREIYGGGFEKVNPVDGYNWYSFFANYGGVPNMFSTPGNKAHSVRKRMISNIYSKSVVTSSPVLLAQTSKVLYERFLPYLRRTCTTGSEKDAEKGVLNIYSLVSATTMDIVTAYIFGLQAGSNFVDDPKELAQFLDLYNSRRSYNVLPQEFPRFSEAVTKWTGYRFAPESVNEANAEIENWAEKMCADAAQILGESDIPAEDTPVVYQQLSSMLSKQAQKDGQDTAETKLLIASEVLDHFAAGFDTSGITLAYVIHELCTHPNIQKRLQKELQTLTPRLEPGSAPALPDPKAVDALPLLHAVVWETLRLHAAIPGPQPRYTPLQGCRLGPEERSYYVPGGVRVSASAGVLHANEDVYENAGRWIPDRWLEDVPAEKKKDMESRWFWAFGR